MTHFEYSFPVRYYETDQMSVVHHSNYVRYFETARNQMMDAWGFPISRFEKDFGILIPIVGLECRFKHPARMGDVLTVTAEIDRVPLAKMVIRQAVFNQDGEVCCEGSVTLGFIDSERFVPVPCPQVLVDVIESHLNDIK